ncbi:MAG: immunity 53 family protein [Clostridia bacterium]|nr:immunity 53 family protein [Clostridia bacterium]
MADTLSKLQLWFRLHCDGEWEHSEGINIETLDNPGWQVQISLKDTLLEQIDFPEILVGDPEKDNLLNDYWEQAGEEWIRCYKEGHTLIGRCSPEMLERTLAMLLQWCEEHTQIAAWDETAQALKQKCNSIEIRRENITAFRTLYQEILALPNEHPMKRMLMQLFYQRWRELISKGFL